MTPVKTNKKRSPYSTRGTGGGLHTYQASRLEGLEPFCSGAGTSAGNVEETASLSTPWAALSATLAPTPVASPDSADGRIDLAVFVALLLPG